MTIKGKLTWNVIITIVIVAGVSIAGILSTVFIKNRLFYLTERSTPFQVRTIEFQRAMQGATADLVRVVFSKDINEYQTYRTQADKSLLEVKNTQRALESISGGSKIETYDELSRIANELYEITVDRISAEEEAVRANRTIMQKLKDTSNRLKELDQKIRAFQLSRSASFVTSLNDTKNISSRLRSIEFLKITLKDIQLAVFEIQQAHDKKIFTIARAKINSSINKMLQNDYVRESKKLMAEIKSIGEKTDELIKIRSSIIGQEDAELKRRLEAINKDIADKISSVSLTIEQEITSASEKYGVETEKQGRVFTQANIATNILGVNSELVSLGLLIEGLSTRLFTLTTSKEIDNVEVEIKKVYEQIEYVQKSMEKALTKLDAKEELKLLNNATTALTSIKGMLLAKDGVITKIRHQIIMREKALQTKEKLKEVVLKHSQKGKEHITVAQEEQEKAIAMVNKMVRFSILLNASVGIGVTFFGIAFGTWIYRSIAKPLNDLIQISDDVSKGDLTTEICSRPVDEIGTVQASMCGMVTNLKEIVGKIRTATESLASSSEELSATATSLEKNS
ncbi:MAG: HAMP domain-containing protein, partial [Thermodesulfovibrionales bacterium]|nr:HAMP domain-containing protein [Thermodesulfovibrionales bacterium]